MIDGGCCTWKLKAGGIDLKHGDLKGRPYHETINKLIMFTPKITVTIHKNTATGKIQWENSEKNLILSFCSIFNLPKTIAILIKKGS